LTVGTSYSIRSFLDQIKEVKEEYLPLRSTLLRTYPGLKEFRHVVPCRTALVIGFFLLAFASHADLPKPLRDAINQSQTDEGMRAFGVLRRYAYSDDLEHRLESRVALAELDRKEKRFDRAAAWVAEYQNPQKENYEWPRARAYIEAAKIQFEMGNTFDSVKSLSDADKETDGLAKVHVKRALSWLVEQKPDLAGALGYEKRALKTGVSHFKRTKISASAGLEPPKPNTDQWQKLKPLIKERIAYLERKIEIDKYGLDYVLYREAQVLRNASHPFAMDFTNVAVVFGKEGNVGGKVPNANYNHAIELYQEIIDFFPDNPYGQAAKLYTAVCVAKKGDVEGAIKKLHTFYKEDPDGLMRGEALKLMGDLYLFALWDKVNAKEAYERSIRWAEAVEGRGRILDTYLVPEKSQYVSKPPKQVKALNNEGEITLTTIPANALVNRVTSTWYLENLVVESEWSLGFLAIVDDDWNTAVESFRHVLDQDRVLRAANQKGFANAFNRIERAKSTGSLLGRKEQMKGLRGKKRIAIQWADLLFIREQFLSARRVYEEIKLFAEETDDSLVYGRALLGIVLVKRQERQLHPESDLLAMHEFVLDNPRNPSAPYMLELCGLLSKGKPWTAEEYFQKVYTTYPSSFYAPRSRYNEILRCVSWGNHELREEKILEFIKAHPEENEYISNLKWVDHEIKEFMKNK